MLFAFCPTCIGQVLIYSYLQGAEHLCTQSGNTRRHLNSLRRCTSHRWTFVGNLNFSISLWSGKVLIPTFSYCNGSSKWSTCFTRLEMMKAHTTQRVAPKYIISWETRVCPCIDYVDKENARRLSNIFKSNDGTRRRKKEEETKLVICCGGLESSSKDDEHGTNEMCVDISWWCQKWKPCMNVSDVYWAMMGFFARWWRTRRCRWCGKGQRECNQQTLKYHQQTTHRFKPSIFHHIWLHMPSLLSFCAPCHVAWCFHYFVLFRTQQNIEGHLFRKL